ncbi:MAG: type I-C CRISPR-associated protein Cas8c/Csd1 [Deltaproteobacteria bacterium]|nr:type I-C CRISPR-associated protein Cas8c/Csd1 [Deltaproteobacteria bacterium]
MAWIQKLYETYENCRTAIGQETEENTAPLLPICHTTQKAHIEIIIDGKGNFKRAQVIPKETSRTIIPATESSAGRTSGMVAHPLCDKLQYVSKDYVKYGGKKGFGFDLYISELKKWCDSDYYDPKIKAVLKYVEKGKVIRDLVTYKILFVKNGKLLGKADYKKDKDSINIFDVVNSQDEAFIRWIVEIPGERESRVWNDKSLWTKWIKYYTSTKTLKTLCYVTGKEEFAADQHPAKLRNDADKAKLISFNDSSGFTFRGRFLSADEAAGISFQVTQKAHNALRWLISRQGYRRDEQAVVAWATSGQDVPQPLADPLTILGINDLSSDESPSAYTAENIGIKFKKRIAGYNAELGNTTGVVVMALDSATPGRMAIVFYRELTGTEYLERINEWLHAVPQIPRYRFKEMQENEKSKRVLLPFTGAPAPEHIAEAAYGEKLDDKLKKATVERLLPCIVDSQPIPRDIVESVVRRASNRIALESWQFEKALSIACALYKKQLKEKEDYSMPLDLNRKTRDYLYGRLLALADSLEGWALNKANEDRQTNAARLMNRFAEHPYSTWRTIELSLQPYKARLGGKSKKRQRMIDEVKDAFDLNDFVNDKRLNGEFLLGYSSQREYLRNSAEKLKETEEDSEQNLNN